MSMKINKLEIENVKRVKAVKIEPSTNGLTIIGGKNNQGKSGHQGRGGQHAGIQGTELSNQQNGRESFGYHQQDIKNSGDGQGSHRRI
mgnify:CR=1 FL=1